MKNKTEFVIICDAGDCEVDEEEAHVTTRKEALEIHERHKAGRGDNHPVRVVKITRSVEGLGGIHGDLPLTREHSELVRGK